MKSKYHFEVIFEKVGVHLFGALVVLFHLLNLKTLSLACSVLMVYCISSYRFYKILDEIDGLKPKKELDWCKDDKRR